MTWEIILGRLERPEPGIEAERGVP